jgi:competence protein ComEC
MTGLGRVMLRVVGAVAVALVLGGPARAALGQANTAAGGSRNLRIYWIDAEGGAATLIVAPTGESLLVDSANQTPDDRDANRIMAAARRAGLSRIDMLLTTHFHADHIGAMAALAKMIPIGQYLDHGESVEIARPQIAAANAAYVERSAGKRRILKPGDRIPLGGVDIQTVMSAGQPITKALKGAGARNDCSDFVAHEPDTDPDNDQSVGILLTFGKFRFIDLGDLTWNYEQKLVCPNNLIGTVDVYQTTHHGLDRSNSPQLIRAIQPKVVVMNNGPRKGGQPSVFETLRKSPALEDIWQGHLALGTPVAVNTNERMIANMGPTAECSGNLLELSVAPNGAYTMTNVRNGFSKSYRAR